jgi:hypothetical protein
MKPITLVFLCLGAIIAWPIAKDAAIDKAMAQFMAQSNLNKIIKDNDIGPLGGMLTTTFGKAYISQMLSSQDIGTQIEVVFRILVLNEIPNPSSL